MVSYNPGYQSVLKDLKDSTRQRMVAIELDFPPADVEEKILLHEAGIDHTTAASLVQLGQAIRRLEASGLREVASTRVLVAAGRLVSAGLSPREACRAAVAGPLTDEPLISAGLFEMIDARTCPRSARSWGRRSLTPGDRVTSLEQISGSTSGGRWQGGALSYGTDLEPTALGGLSSGPAGRSDGVRAAHLSIELGPG